MLIWAEGLLLIEGEAAEDLTVATAEASYLKTTR
jgi:hypothetical protein